MLQPSGTRFLLTLCCPYPRHGFGDCETPAADPLAGMEHILRQAGDLAVFPEGFLPADMLPQAAALARRYGKWVVLGTEDGAPGRCLAVAVLSPEAGLIHSHRKTALTDADTEAGRTPGQDITAVKTPFGVLGTPLCYEIHFPEIARIFALQGAALLLNPIGTGMWHAQQLDEWTAIAKARAIENGVFVAGCTHCCGEIPLAYAYGPDGAMLGRMTHTAGALHIAVDTARLPPRDWTRHRTPLLYDKLRQPI